MRSSDDAAAGFTLVETIVAFSVAALVMTGVFELLSRDIQAVAETDDHTRAMLAAESRMEAAGIVIPLAAGTTRGRIDDRFSWTERVSRIVLPGEGGAGGGIGLYRVTVTVTWQSDGRPRSVVLDGLKPGPAR